MHVASAMSSKPKSEWCTCLELDGSRGEYPPKSGRGRGIDGKELPPRSLWWAEVSPYVIPGLALLIAAVGTSEWFKKSLPWNAPAGDISK